jgi:hypothetical protein
LKSWHSFLPFLGRFNHSWIFFMMWYAIWNWSLFRSFSLYSSFLFFCLLNSFGIRSVSFFFVLYLSISSVSQVFPLQGVYVAKTKNMKKSEILKNPNYTRCFFHLNHETTTYCVYPFPPLIIFSNKEATLL